MVVRAISVTAAKHTLFHELVDVLFLQIALWNDYRRLATRPPVPSRWVVFPLGEDVETSEKLTSTLGACLRSPISAIELTVLWQRLSDSSFSSRPFDGFFLRVGAGYEPIAIGGLKEVRKHNGVFEVITRHGRYASGGDLTSFLTSLPMALTPAGPGHWINKRYL